jgi:uncharacterized protein (TIGR03663 family)
MPLILDIPGLMMSAFKMRRLPFTLVCIAPVLVAAALRFPQLAQRPMHCDEAVNADKFGTLLESGRYEYNPVEFHGPTLYYLTLLPARLQGNTRYTSISEVTVRSVPASAGVGLVAVHTLLVPLIGVTGAATAGLLAAISPAMVFYSRYYIHETLLVFFSFGMLVSACRYLLKPRASWAVVTGACIGLMHATKETSAIAFASVVLAVAVTLLFEKWRGISSPPLLAAVRPPHLVAALVTALLVSGLFHSSFFSNWKGIADSLRAYGFYLDRATSTSLHIHPWHYYLRVLLFSHSENGPVWSEGLIAGLALPAFIAAWSRPGVPGVNQRLLRFLAAYTLFMIVIYSAIPHKTPWCLLGFLHGLILLAGAGTALIASFLKRASVRVAACALAAFFAANLAWQAWAGSFRYAADPRNPYVYAHTGTDVFLITRRVEDLARAHPQGLAMPVQIISRENLWPLPWYLRRFSAVQWWNGVSDAATSAPVILATPDMEAALVRKLYELPPPGERDLYMAMFSRCIDLRPQVELRGYAIKWLWDDYSQLEANGSNPSPSEPRK